MEKDESPAKKLKMETKETETKKMDNISEEKVKVKKAQNVQERLAEIKSAYNENTKDDMDDHCGADKVGKIDDELDVAIEKTEKVKEAKDDEDEEEREEKQNASDSYCQVTWLTSLFLKSSVIHGVLLIRSAS